MGDTDYRNAFNATATGRATDPDEAFPGVIDRGTWVESKFDLARFAGRRIRMRFLWSTIEVNDIPNYESAFVWNPVVFDDGWYIDNVIVSNTLTTAATVAADGTDNSALPGCGNFCNTLSAGVVADPPSTGAPGATVELDASSSTADRCVDGTLQYKFYVDADNSGTIDGADTLLRDWTDNPLYLDAPTGTKTYAVEARCSSDTACGTGTDNHFAFVTVSVSCPSTGNLKTSFSQAIGADSKTQFSWGVADTVDVYRGNLSGAGSGGGANSLTGTGSFLDTVESCLQDDANISSFTDATNPNAASGVYYLVRPKGGAFCNQAGSWNSGGTGQAGDRDADIDASANACP